MNPFKYNPQDAFDEYNQAMAQADYDFLFKLVVIGESGTGKSSLLMRYTEDVFSDVFISTIGVDFKLKTINVNNKRVKLQIWDTAGQERFRTITTSYYRGAQGIVLCYDITDRLTFQRLENWLGEVQRYGKPGAPVILCGLKADLEPTREVSKVEAQNFASRHNMLFVETSAKKNAGIDEAFNKLTAEVLAETRRIDDSVKPTIKPTPDKPASSSWCFC